MKRLGLIASSGARVYAVYAALALAVLAPLLSIGYILTLDMVFTPQLRMPVGVGNDYLFRVLLHVLNFVLPSDVIEKLLMFLILLLSGVGMHLLLQSLAKHKADIYQRLGWYFGGVLYMINPFTYDRFMAGQYDVLLGYALLPWFVRALLGVLATPGLRRAVVFAARAVVISIVSIHAVGLLFILDVVGFAVVFRRRRHEREWVRRIVRYGLLAIALFVLASSYWLVPLALGHGSTATTIGSFTGADQTAFETLGGNTLARLGHIICLQGFWAEGRGLFNLPQDQISVWGMLALLVWLLVITGGISYWRARQRSVVVIFGGSAAIAAILAAGTFNGWLTTHVPLFAGYREPQKFVALVALAYAVFAGRGVAAVLQYCREQGGRVWLVGATVVLLAIPLVWTPTMLWGFNGQLSLAEYPTDWFAVNRRLDADPGNFQVLFLPWHQYMYFDFAGRIIASPAPQFFDKPVLVSNNPEFRGIPAVPNATDTGISRLLPPTDGNTNLGAQLVPFNVKYVLLARYDDYATYGYLNRQADLKLVSKGATLDLYQNEAYRGR